MRIAVTANGPGLDSPFVPVFGRCPSFVLVDPETLACEALPNEAVGALGGAGIQAAQAVVARGVGAVITGQVGPNAYRVLEAAGVPIYLFGSGTVREAVQAYRAGRLRSTTAATARGHAGLGLGGPGMGRGRGPGGGQGRGFGGGRGGPSPQPARSGSSEAQAELRELRARLEETQARLDELEARRQES